MVNVHREYLAELNEEEKSSSNVFKFDANEALSDFETCYAIE